MKTISSILILAVFAGVLSGCSKKSGAAGPPEKQIIGTDAANEPTPFKFAWLPGKRYAFRIETVKNFDLTQPGSSTNQTIAFALSQDYSLSAGPLRDGVQELDMEITAQRFVFQSAERNYLISDSRQSADEDAADPVSPFLRPMINATFKCFIADGDLIRTEGLDALTAGMQNASDDIKPLIESVLNEKNVKVFFDSLSAAQPDAPVKVGDSWPMHLEMDPYRTRTLIQDGQNTFTNWDTCENRQCVHTVYRGTYSPKAGDTNDSEPDKMQDGTISGEAWFDPQLGMLVHSATLEHLNGIITVNDQDLPARVSVTSNFRLISVEDQ